MKSYEIIARKAEDYSKQRWSVREKSSLTTGFDITQKDSLLNRILDCISWLDRLPGSKDKKAPYLKRVWDSYLKVQNGLSDDTTMIPQLIGGNRMEYIEDQAVEHSIADSGIGTGGLGYASIQEQSIGTEYRQKPKDPYWNDKIPKSECRTLEGEEKDQAYRDYLASLNRPIEESV